MSTADRVHTPTASPIRNESPSLLRTAFCLLVLAAVALACGCSSPEMRGTPFYRGELAKRTEASANRVNIWPLLYYQEPVLSVLWPIGEVTDDHVAVRPIASVYKLDEERPEVSVLWPVSDLDFDEREYRAFPAFWGEQSSGEPYAVLFPGLWYIPGHFNGIIPVFWSSADDGADGDGLEWMTVFPLGWYEKNEHIAAFPLLVHFWKDGGYSTHAPWPLVNVKTGDGETGWHLWPLYGHYRNKSLDTERRYALWPLIMQLRRGEKKTRWLFPLYAGQTDPQGQWNLLAPFFYQGQAEEKTRTVLLPFFYHADSGQEGWIFASPLYSGGRSPESSWNLLFPLYFGSTSSEVRRMFVSPSFYHSASEEEANTLLFPLFYRWKQGDSSMFLTPPGGISRSPEDTSLYAFPLLSAYSRGEQQSEFWFLFPLAHAQWGEDANQSHIFPLYYWRERDNLLLTLPFSYRNPEDEKEGFMSFLGPLAVYGWDEGKKKLSFLWPLISAESDEGGFSHRFLPFWYYQREGARSYLNVGGVLLNSWLSPNSGDFYTALPPAGASWNEDETEHGLWPLYFYGSGEETWQVHPGPFLPFDGDERPRDVLSLMGYTGRETGRSVWMVPFYDSEDRETEQWAEDSQLMQGEVCKSTSVGFPLWFYNSHVLVEESVEEAAKASSLEDVAMERPDERTRFNILGLLANYESRTENAKKANPLGEREFNLLWRLYDYEKEMTAGEEETGSRNVYVRHRILWRLMHYERTNDYTTLDLFPGITWDSKEGEQETFSFLWRFLRYEWDREEGTRFYFFFIPF